VIVPRETPMSLPQLRNMVAVRRGRRDDSCRRCRRSISSRRRSTISPTSWPARSSRRSFRAPAVSALDGAGWIVELFIAKPTTNTKDRTAENAELAESYDLDRNMISLRTLRSRQLTCIVFFVIFMFFVHS